MKLPSFKAQLLTFIAAAIFSVGTARAATDTTNAKIVMLRVGANGSAVITFNKDGAGRPGCATYDNGRSLSVDTTNAAGQEMMRVALAGYLAGKTFRVVGTGSCTIQNNKEDLSHFYMD